MNKEGAGDITNIKALMLQVLFSTAGISAFLYVCGMLALRSKLNMLGIWTGVDLNSYDYLDESIRIFSSLPIILLFLSASAVPFLLVTSVAGLFGYSFPWHSNRFISRRYLLPLVLLSLLLIYFFLLPMGNADLLFRNDRQLNDCLALVVSRGNETWAFFCMQILVSLLLFFLLYRLWSTNYPRRNIVYQYFKWAMAIIFLINCILIPINYGVMISPINYHQAEVSLTRGGIVDGDTIQGNLLLQTDRELVLYVKNTKEGKGSLFVINRADIGGIRIDDAPQSLLAEIWPDEKTKRPGMMKMGKIFLIVVLLFFVTLTSAFAEKKSDLKNIQPLENEKTETTISADTNILFQLFPTLVDHLSTFGNEITTILNNFQNIIKGDREAESLPDRKDLNIWIYDINGKKFRQITSDGGYFSPRVSPDGQRICFIKDSKLWKMTVDGTTKILIDQQQPYDRVLGWDGKSHYLLVGKNKKLYLLERQQKELREMGLGSGKLKNITVDTFIRISQTASNGKMIYAAGKGNDSRRLIEDHDDYMNAKVILDDGSINLSPCWLNHENGIIYVSNRKNEEK